MGGKERMTRAKSFQRFRINLRSAVSLRELVNYLNTDEERRKILKKLCGREDM
jgi:hypothetical protein